MRFSPAKLLVRLTSGLGLLLLVASQEKVCPWLGEVPVLVRQAARDDQGRTGDDSASREVPPPSLASTLPDVVAPRRPDRGPLGPLQLDRGRPVPPTLTGRFAGDDDGAWSLGMPAPSFCGPWPDPRNVLCAAVPGGQIAAFRQTALLTSMFINGPPIG